MNELERLVRRLLEAWDAWIDADAWSGPQYDALNDAVQALRQHIEAGES
jgi:hypothetical protein